ncbi:hypothetical protein DV702_01215 [Sporosarcina sp. PTS2304]|uniref:hypothetical protein n=1 Tax=Sporosarcina sp. PTS2304 TaxID=2283194 RepID=UPI000E0DC491|nr:hypothetical protein [Sporosarcina sp. PTS2304]AXH98445.1 hypothetical protein DV702_01215 [Sporosarcina sp. PTS2304]
MELKEVKITISHKFNFFENKEIDRIISNIPFNKLETQVSEMNKLAIIKMENNFYMIISDKSIQFRMRQLDVLNSNLEILNVFDENIKEYFRLELISFNGILHETSNEETYNQSFGDNFPSCYKVRMLGIDIESDNFMYRLSLNKKKKFTKVMVNTLVNSNIQKIEQNCKGAYEEFIKKLEILYPLL